ncbi:2-phospho-L-lactate guanylyltransferase [uncultured Cohaesibacter sp.]|uniref:2-phospho-L-lactate guanylyltransferase n=1 Tax=uncultured Cohaesibacter sp. TaxID=1002546 RepID=UPI002AAB5701|nr:2-phospho-L-lactate guanylyltransferase [uncultured Cohaesibacter sp.]
MSERVLVLIPMKAPTQAKSRLKSVLSDRERSALALSLFKVVVTRVKDAVQRLSEVGGNRDIIDIAVISSSDTIESQAADLGIIYLEEETGDGLVAAVEEAAAKASWRGYKRLCILPGDLADPSASDIIRLLSYPVDEGTIALCPSQDLGTNALVVTLPSPMPFAFGPESFTRHFSLAADRGLMPVILPLKSLRRDIDTLADLDYLDDNQTLGIMNREEA